MSSSFLHSRTIVLSLERISDVPLSIQISGLSCSPFFS